VIADGGVVSDSDAGVGAGAGAIGAGDGGVDGFGAQPNTASSIRTNTIK